jgi:hypothetical protein
LGVVLIRFPKTEAWDGDCHGRNSSGECCLEKGTNLRCCFSWCPALSNPLQNLSCLQGKCLGFCHQHQLFCQFNPLSGQQLPFPDGNPMSENMDSSLWRQHPKKHQRPGQEKRAWATHMQIGAGHKDSKLFQKERSTWAKTLLLKSTPADWPYTTSTEGLTRPRMESL